MIAPANIDAPKLLLNAAEACHALAICRKTLYSLEQRGELVPVRIGTAPRWSVRAIEQWIAKQEAEGQR